MAITATRFVNVPGATASNLLGQQIADTGTYAPTGMSGDETDAINVVADIANQATTMAVNSVATASAVTISAAQMTQGVYTMTGSTATALTVDNAANIIAALKNAQVGSSFMLLLRNTSSATVTITQDSGATVTLPSVTSLTTNHNLLLIGVVTAVGASAAVTLYSVSVAVL